MLLLKINLKWIEPFFTHIAIIILAFVLGRLLSILLRRYIRRSAKSMNVDPTNYSFLQHAVSMVVFLGGVLFVFWKIPFLHDFGKTLFAGAGIFAAILGFASQEAFSNIISGIFLVIYKPFSVGDNIKLLSNGQAGKVEDITLRHTIIKAAENRRLVIPNSVISREQIVNSNIKDVRIMLFLEVLITYDSDHSKALAVMKEEAMKHPFFIDGRSIKQKMENADVISGRIIALEDKGVRLRVAAWARNDDQAFEMKCDLLKTLKERFAAEGIAIAHSENVLEKK